MFKNNSQKWIYEINMNTSHIVCTKFQLFYSSKFFNSYPAHNHLPTSSCTRLTDPEPVPTCDNQRGPKPKHILKEEITSNIHINIGLIYHIMKQSIITRYHFEHP